MECFSVSTLNINAKELAKKLHADIDMVAGLTGTLSRKMDIKAAFRSSYVDEKEESAVMIDGVRFTIRVLAKNLSNVGRAFPYILTLGHSVDELLEQTEDLLVKYLLDEIGNAVLRSSRQKLQKHFMKKYALRRVSSMSPGSLEDWPIGEQKNLFVLLNGAKSIIGVRLTDSLLMVPRKSVSGIFFPSETTFLSCELCPRKRCEGRKAPFNPEKARDYGVSLNDFGELH